MNIFECEKFLNSILEPWNFNDFCHNGIQIEGKEEVKKIACGVSFNEDFIDKAIDYNADMLLVHHGIFGKNFFNLSGFMKKRVEKVIKNDLTLIGYHLPLDAHSGYGNNISILNSLKLKNAKRFEVGFLGEYDSKMDFEEFLNKVEILFEGQKLLVYKNNPHVKNVAIVSGEGSDFLNKLNDDIDTFITGDVKEYTRNIAKERCINFINAGHYATETFGVKNLSKLLSDKFDVEFKFLDIYNEI